MNLNTSNPLLLAAITGGGGVSGGRMMDPMITTTIGGGGCARGLFFRSRTHNPDSNNDYDDDDDNTSDLFSQSGHNGSSDGFHPYMMGPLQPAGTDKDIISGISFQLTLNLLRKSGQTDVVVWINVREWCGDGVCVCAFGMGTGDELMVLDAMRLKYVI
jgi:hypothetical protein